MSKEIMRDVILYGALGDALGYQIEFDREDEIDRMFEVVTFDHLVVDAKVISDDTQMSLYTLEGILLNPEDPILSIYDCYKDWAQTQGHDHSFASPEVSKLAKEDVLRVDRAPGMTCLNALYSNTYGTLEDRINDSKGCGGVMRLAPLAVYYALYSERSSHDICILGVETSALTHGHDMSMLASYHFVDILVSLIRNPEEDLERVIKKGLKRTIKAFRYSPLLLEYQSLILNTLDLSKNGLSDRDNIHILGEGWVAEEALSIALYAVLKYQKDSKQALLVSVNHRGDSDSTGILCGNILALSNKQDEDFEKYFKNIDAYHVINSLINEL